MASFVGSNECCLLAFIMLIFSMTALVPTVQGETFEDESGRARVEVSASFSSGPGYHQACATLTNVSIPPTTLPNFTLKIVGFGFASASDPADQLHLFMPNAFDQDGKFWSTVELPGGDPTTADADIVFAATDGGLDIGGQIFGCIVLFSTNELAHEHLLSRFFVVLDDGVSSCGEFSDSETSGNLARVNVVHIAANEACINVRNPNEGSAVITGIGFAFDESLKPFALSSISPRAQPGDQNLLFSESFGRLRLSENWPSGSLSFALLTGRTFERGLSRFGIFPGYSSSTFCVTSDNDLNSLHFINKARIRFEDSYGSLRRICGVAFPGTGGLRGSVATLPR